MRKPKRLVAQPVAEMLSPDTGRVVGWRYRWDDGTESQISAVDIPAALMARDRALNRTVQTRPARSAVDEPLEADKAATH